MLRSDFRSMPTVVSRDIGYKGYIIATRYKLGVWTNFRLNWPGKRLEAI